MKKNTTALLFLVSVGLMTFAYFFEEIYKTKKMEEEFKEKSFFSLPFKNILAVSTGSVRLEKIRNRFQLVQPYVYAAQDDRVRSYVQRFGDLLMERKVDPAQLKKNDFDYKKLQIASMSYEDRDGKYATLSVFGPSPVTGKLYCEYKDFVKTDLTICTDQKALEGVYKKGQEHYEKAKRLKKFFDVKWKYFILPFVQMVHPAETWKSFEVKRKGKRAFSVFLKKKQTLPSAPANVQYAPIYFSSFIANFKHLRFLDIMTNPSQVEDLGPLLTTFFVDAGEKFKIFYRGNQSRVWMNIEGQKTWYQLKNPGQGEYAFMSYKFFWERAPQVSFEKKRQVALKMKGVKKKRIFGVSINRSDIKIDDSQIDIEKLKPVLFAIQGQRLHGEEVYTGAPNLLKEAESFAVIELPELKRKFEILKGKKFSFITDLSRKKHYRFSNKKLGLPKLASELVMSKGESQ